MAETTTAVIEQTPKLLETVAQLAHANPWVASLFILVIGGLIAYSLKFLLDKTHDAGGGGQTSHGDHSPIINAGRDVKIIHAGTSVRRGIIIIIPLTFMALAGNTLLSDSNWQFNLLINQGNHGPIIQVGPGGNLTIQGIPDAALVQLNHELMNENLQLQEKIKIAESWAEKYRALEFSLPALGGVDATKAKVALESGDLDKADELLRLLLPKVDEAVAKGAVVHANLARLAEMRFRPLDALPHWETAYRLQPENVDYAHAYALLLLKQNQYNEATPIFEATLARLRKQAQSDPTSNLPNLITTLNDIGSLYQNSQRINDSEKAFQEALIIAHQLAQSNPAAALPHVANSLNSLGMIFINTKRMDDSEKAFLGALKSYQQLAQDNPAAYRSQLANIFNNLGMLYHLTQRMDASEKAYQEALETYRQLAEDNPAANMPNVANTLTNLGTLYSSWKRMDAAEEALKEALSIRRQLVQTNPNAYMPNLATTLNNLSELYLSMQQHTEEAEKALKEALSIYRQLAQTNPDAFLPTFAEANFNLGVLYQVTQRMGEAERAYQEALTIHRQLETNNPKSNKEVLASILHNLAVLHLEKNQSAQARQEALEAAEIKLTNARTYPQYFGDEPSKSLSIALLAMGKAPTLSPPPCNMLMEALTLAQSKILQKKMDSAIAKHCPAASAG